MYNIGVIGSGHSATPPARRLPEKDGFVLKAVCDTNIAAVKEKYSNLDSGILSAKMCLLEQKSSDNFEFYNI